MKLDELVDACIRVQRKRLGLPVDAPITPEEREAMASVLEVAAAYRPGLMAHIEASKGRAVADEIRARRSARDQRALEERAAPVVAAVAAEASAETGFDLTPALLTGPSRWRRLIAWRDLAWWRLAREGMTTRQLGLVFGCGHNAVVYGIGRHDKRLAAVRTADLAEVAHGR